MSERAEHETPTKEIGGSDLPTREIDETACMEAESPASEPPTRTREIAEPEPRWILEVLEGPARGREIAIPSGRVSLGRSARCALCIDDPAISRLHLWVEARPEGILLHAESTKNGTSLDGAPFLEGLAREGQRIGLGQSLLVLRRAEGASDAGGVVGQAFRLLRGAPAVDAPPMPRRRTVLLASGLVGLGVALVAWAGPRPGEPTFEEIDGRAREARLEFDQGIERLGSGDLEGARRHFEAASEKDPESEEPGRYLGWLEGQDGEVGLAEASFDEEEAPEGEALASEDLGAEERGGLDEPVDVGVLPAAAEAPDREPAPESVRVVRSVPTKVVKPAPRPRRSRAAPAPRAEARRREARDEIEAALERARREEGLVAVESLDAAWRRARNLPASEPLVGALRHELAARAFEAGEDALRLGSYGRALQLFRMARDARPSHEGAGERLAELRARASTFLVEGYALRDRDPDRSRAWLELVRDLTEPADPLHQRAVKWLERAAHGTTSGG